MSSSEDPSSSSNKKEQDAETSQSEESITFTVKSINDKKISTTVSPFISVAELKQKLAEEADIPADRQRLIYSGHVLKDDRTIDSYKVKDGHTIHLVKGAASNATAATGNPSVGASTTTGAPGAGSTGSTAGGAAPPPAVPNMAAGTGSSPFSRLTNHIQLPSSSLFGPDGGMGAPPNPDEMLRMMEQPEFRATMNELLRNPTMLDHIIQSNPMLQQLGPNARQMMQTEEFRQMMTNPELLRQMASMQQMLGLGPFGGAMGAGGAGSSFPAPGVTDQTPSGSASSTTAGTNSSQTATSGDNTSSTGSQPGAAPPPPPNPFANPFAMLFNNPAGQNTQGTQAGSPQPGGAPANPLANLFSNPAFMNAAAQAGAGARGPDQTTGNNETGGGQQQQSQPPPNPLLPNIDYNQMMQMMQMFGGPGGGLGGVGTAGGGGGAAANPPDTRPIEERYAEQLRQLNDMGFYDFDRNCEALRRTGGSVQGAVEYLLSNP